MKLREWAIKNSVCYKTAYRMFRNGLINNARQLPTGTIVIDEDLKQNIKSEYNVVYSRVSSTENKNNLDSQAKRVRDFCNARGWVVNEIVKECASGLNDKRPKLQKILNDKKATRIIVEHKDRLTRFGFEYIKTLFDGEIIVINEVIEDDPDIMQDIMQDFVSIVTSFCARIYGQRRSKRKTESIIKELESRD